MSRTWSFTSSQEINIAQLIEKINVQEYKVNYPQKIEESSVITDAVSLLNQGKSLRGVQIIRDGDNYTVRSSVLSSKGDYQMLASVLKVLTEEYGLDITADESGEVLTAEDIATLNGNAQQLKLIRTDLDALHSSFKPGSVISLPGIVRPVYIDKPLLEEFADYQTNEIALDELFSKLIRIQFIQDEDVKVPNLMKAVPQNSQDPKDAKMLVAVDIQRYTFIPKVDLIHFYIEKDDSVAINFSQLETIGLNNLEKLDNQQYLFTATTPTAFRKAMAKMKESKDTAPKNTNDTKDSEDKDKSDKPFWKFW